MHIFNSKKVTTMGKKTPKIQSSTHAVLPYSGTSNSGHFGGPS